MWDVLFALGQFVCFIGLAYGAITTFANWRESGQFGGAVGPSLPRERQALAPGRNVDIAAFANETARLTEARCSAQRPLPASMEVGNALRTC